MKPVSTGTSGLGPVAVNKKRGSEPFHEGGGALNFDLLSFWQWSSSDLLNNTLRGILAEYLVSRALGHTTAVRSTWDSFDIVTSDGLRVEVKSAAYLQSWHQSKLSQIAFSTRPTLGWDAATNEWEVERRRQADVYVFCLLTHEHKATVDPLNVAQWRFFVIAARRLDETIGTQKSIGLARLQAIGAVAASYGELAEAVGMAARAH